MSCGPMVWINRGIYTGTLAQTTFLPLADPAKVAADVRSAVSK